MLAPTTKPYFLRALYEWCTDQNQTPHLLVEVSPECRVPMQFVKDGSITLNIGPMASKNLTMDNDWIQFTARFGGVSQRVAVPVARVAALYARESQEGMGFEVEDFNEEAVQAKQKLNPLQDERSDEPQTSSFLRSDTAQESEKDKENKAKQEARARFKLVED